MSLMDRMMKQNMKMMKKMQKDVLDMQEELYNENGEQIERVSKMSAERGAPATKIHYEAVAKGVKEGLSGEEKKYCSKCGAEIDVDANFCSKCGAKQK